MRAYNGDLAYCARCAARNELEITDLSFMETLGKYAESMANKKVITWADYKNLGRFLWHLAGGIQEGDTDEILSE